MTSGLSNHWATHGHPATEQSGGASLTASGTHAGVLWTGLVSVEVEVRSPWWAAARGFPRCGCRHQTANGLDRPPPQEIYIYIYIYCTEREIVSNLRLERVSHSNKKNHSGPRAKTHHIQVDLLAMFLAVAICAITFIHLARS